MRPFLVRLMAVFRRRTLDRQLEEELRFHLECEAEANRRRGMSADEADQAARRAFGNPGNITEIYREQRGLPMLEVIFKDLRYGLRALGRNPGFTAIAVLSLALGIGANTAIFSLIQAVMLRPLPVPNPATLVSVGDTSRINSISSGSPQTDVFSYPMYQRLRANNAVFEGLLASGTTSQLEVASASATPEKAHGRFVSGNYFQVLGISAARGRTFTSADEGAPGASPSVVISDDYWTTKFARDPAVVGRDLRINGHTFTIIGIGPSGFTGESIGQPLDLWMPISMQPQVDHDDSRLNDTKSNWLLFLGRLKPGVTVAAAKAQTTALVIPAAIEFAGTQFKAEEISRLRRQTVDVEPAEGGLSPIRKRLSRTLFTLMFVVGMVLLIACANVANLLLARAASRQKELSVRLAIGASRSRLIRQLLTESVLLGAFGGIGGIALSWLGVTLLLRFTGDGAKTASFDLSPDPATLAFTGAISLLTGLIFGLAPALRSTRVQLASTLKESARSVTGNGWHLGKLLVAAQVGLSLFLLIGAGLLIRSVINLQKVDVGYSRNNIVLLRIDAAASGYPKSQALPLARRVAEHLGSLPGVTGVSFSQNGIFSGTESMSDGLLLEGFTPATHDDTAATFDKVGPHYFQVVGVPVLAGREFDERDVKGSQPVALINETMARFYFGKSNPLGKSIRDDERALIIVGVVADMRGNELKGKMERRFYMPILQSSEMGTINFEIRTRGDATAMLTAIRQDLSRFDASLTRISLQSVGALIARSYEDEQMIAGLCGFFGILSLVLAAIGLYGVVAYATSRRTNEIGLRLALGASRTHVVNMVLRESLLLVAAGIVVGLPLTLAATRLIAASLVGVGASDPPTLGTAVLIMLTVAVLAGLVPASRASRIDPMTALRQE